MWITKKVALLNDPSWQPAEIVTRESLAEHQQALSLLALAEQQAQARLEEARLQADALLAETRARVESELAEQIIAQQQDFLTRSEQIFSAWQAERDTWQQGLLPHAEALLTQAMNQLLAELPAAGRVETMLCQLMKAQGRPVSATLLCPPHCQQAVADWLEHHPELAWQLKTDAGMESDSLILTTETGELHLNWSMLCKALLPAT